MSTAGPGFINESGAPEHADRPDAMARRLTTPTEMEGQLRPNQVLAEALQDGGFHPVVLCGTSNAGKTTMLASLCAYLGVSGMAQVEFVDSPILESPDGSKTHLVEAKTFFYQVVKEFEQGIAPQRTSSMFPYIVPLEITPRNLGGRHAKPVRIALMDMRGELFKPQVGDPLSLSPTQFHHDVSSLLLGFSAGVSMMYLAPTTRVDAYVQNPEREPDAVAQVNVRIQESPDEALCNALSAYTRTRPRKVLDRHLFLVSKWDIEAGGADALDFSEPDSERVERFVTNRYRRSWAQFNALNAAEDAKWFTQYCAGIISGRQVVMQPSPQEPLLARYAEVVWNWLWQSATMAPANPNPSFLFPSAVLRRPDKMTRIMNGMLGR